MTPMHTPLFILCCATLLCVAAAAGAPEDDLVLTGPQALIGNEPTSGPAGPEDCSKAGCHDDFKKKSSVHTPIAKDSCDPCHTLVDEEKHQFKTLEEPNVCRKCHVDLTKDVPFLHGPVASGECTSCHDPHASDIDGVLLEEGTALCIQCHDEMGETIEGSSTKHQPATEDCTSCHNPHGGNDKFNLNELAPALCLDCHDELGKKIEGSTVKHDAVTTEKSCLNCHNSHASNIDGMLLEEPMKLCLSCHSKDIEVEGRKLLNIGKHLESNPHHHGPIQQGDCISCHDQVHGGTEFRLLMGKFPTSFYSAFDEKLYGLCFECHEADLVKVAKTDDVTEFRNGKTNLHFLHVNKKQKGRTCRACHELHASKTAGLIRESIPFGKRGWLLPLGFKKTPNGGSCAPGCHRPYSYDRVTAAINTPVAPKVPPKVAPKVPPKGGEKTGS